LTLNDESPNIAHEAVAIETSERLPKPARGERLRLHTDSFAFEGKAVARRHDGYVVFVEGALGQEDVTAEVFKAKGRYAEAKLIEVHQASPDRATPPCPYYGPCGGCALQHMTYPAQLKAKRQQVVDLFERIGKIESPNVHETIGVEGEPFFYRNKMEFSFSEERWLMDEEIATGDVVDRFALGLHVRERFDRVIDTNTCLLPSPIAPKIVNFTREFARESGLGVFGPDKNPDGFFRFLITRTSGHTDDVMVNIVTSRYEKGVMEQYRDGLLKTVPEVTTIVNNINGRRAQVALGDSEELIYGEGFITDRIGPNSYRISANSFFQTNTRQAERLYQIACDFAELKQEDTLWDLYCGAGTISLFVAAKVKHVLGIELAESAVRDARANAASNKVEHVEFVASDLRKAITSPEFIAEHALPDVMIIDPPRSGMHPDVVREVLSLAPKRIAYISCNPATQARDIEMLSERYELVELQPVDMFPQTFHIECVAKLRWRA